MKRVVSLILVLAMCLFLCACGSGNENTAEVKSETEEIKQPLFKDPKQEAFEISKEAYENIKDAAEITHRYAAEFYEAWRVGAYDKKELIEGSCAYLASELNYLTEEDIREAITYIALTDLEQTEWENISEEKKEDFRKNKADNYFYYNQDKMFYFCGRLVQTCFQLNGKTQEAQEYLDIAKGLLKEMTAQYSDYEYYPQLKDYYTSVSSFLDLCNNPGGYSFEQIKTTISEYNNEIRDYQNDLEFIFED